MLCPLCQSETSDSAVYCDICGEKIPRCPVCNRVIDRRMRFCMYDGTPLPAEIVSLFPAPAAGGTGTGESSARTSRSSPHRQPGSFSKDTLYENPDREPGRDFEMDLDLDEDLEDPDGAPDGNGRSYSRSGSRRGRTAVHPKRQASGGRWKTSILAVILILLLSLLVGISVYFLASDRNRPDSQTAGSSSAAVSSSTGSGQSGSGSSAAGGEAVAPALPETDPSTSLSESEGEPEPEGGTESEEPAEETAEEQDALIYFLTNSDKMYFTEEDIQSFDAWSARTACNGIYARAGRKFNTTEVMDYFLQFDWYTPQIAPEDFTDSMLNEYQKANLELILNFEEKMGYR